MVPRHVTAGLAMFASLGACSFAPIELDGLQCPCAAGWSCVDDVCVENGGADLDLGAPPDLGRRDGGTVDAGPVGVDDGGPPADGGTDVGVDAGSDAGLPSVCATSTAFFCDGFEGGVVPPWAGVRTTNGATFTDDGMPFRGERSAHAITSAPSSRAHVEASLGGRTGVTLYAKTWLYVPTASEHEVLSFLLIGHDADPDYPLVALQSVPGSSQVYVGMPFGRPGAGGSGEPVPRDRWVCATLSIETGTDTPRLHATIDGNVVADETFSGPVVPEADFGMAGIEFTNAGTPSAELFIDEVEFGTEPLTCP
ncbi:MAG: hypothetical protein JJ863_17165 [Deltaproteobacteria bacterium]|nr:hypothetical protein [Deltaproteobacteria bacterium]